MTRAGIPQISFADLEFLKQGIELDPILKRIGSFLDQHPELEQEVRQDLERGLKKPDTGRSGMTPSQARRRMQEIQRMTARERHDQQLPKYREMISITGQVIQEARKVLEETKKKCAEGLIEDIVLSERRRKLEYYCQLGDRVVDQTRRRVLQGEQVPTEEKLYSIFEPHTALIKRGKIQKPLEFGHKIFLAESAHGLISQYCVLEGNSAAPRCDPQCRRGNAVLA